MQVREIKFKQVILGTASLCLMGMLFFSISSLQDQIQYSATSSDTDITISLLDDTTRDMSGTGPVNYRVQLTVSLEQGSLNLSSYWRQVAPESILASLSPTLSTFFTRPPPVIYVS